MLHIMGHEAFVTGNCHTGLVADATHSIKTHVHVF